MTEPKPDPQAPNRAGAVCFNRAGQILLVGALNGKTPPTWVLPKGHIESGEELWEAAQREVIEEAGIVAVIDSSDPICTTSYDDKGEAVCVAWFAAQAVGMTKQTDTRAIRWAHWRAALDLIKIPGLKFVIRTALCMKEEK